MSSIESYEFQITCLEEENKQLRALVRHMHIHDGYPWNGFVQMTDDEKVMYLNCLNCDFSGDEPQRVYYHTIDSVLDQISSQKT